MFYFQLQNYGNLLHILCVCVFFVFYLENDLISYFQSLVIIITKIKIFVLLFYSFFDESNTFNIISIFITLLTD